MVARRTEPLHVLVLTDRDWEHPQAGGTGTVLESHVTRWLEWGHRVTIVTSAFPGAAETVRRGGLTIHRAGRLKTATPSVARRARRRFAADADVALELVNGVFFMTPVWLRVPCITLVQHLSGGAQYRLEFGRLGPLLGLLLESLPLRTIYRGRRFMTISEATADGLAAHGIAREDITVNLVGVEEADFVPRNESAAPRLICLGRLKRYKNIEAILDALAQLPGVELDLVGDGDHRAGLEREVERRGLGERVVFHGFVDEDRKRELLAGAWVNVSASTAEGWGLSVTEGAACGTPSVALATGGLQEAIVDGETGLLARAPEELPVKLGTLLRDDGLRERMGSAARERARSFTWDATAARTIELLESERARVESGGTTGGLASLAGSDTGRAVGLAAAAMATNVVALILTVVFARLLGADGYGTLAALMSAFLILGLPGQALQVTIAREVSREFDGHDPALAANVRRWLRSVGLLTLAAAAAAVVLREPLADLLGVDAPWGAAAVPMTACAWMMLSIQRGVLQGTGAYRTVGLSLIGESLARLVAGTVLIGAGLGPTGAFLGTVVSVVGTSLVLAPRIHARVSDGTAGSADRRLHEVARSAGVPLASLALIAWLQNVDVILVKRLAETEAAASSYAAASVAGKMVVWIGVGLGLFLLPEAARRASAGTDGRPVLARSLALVASVGVPMVLIYAVAGRPLLEAVFGPELGLASDALPWLGIAMTFLACSYLGVQFLLGIGRAAFLPLLAAIAIAEPLVLLSIGAQLTEIALALGALHLLLAVTILAVVARKPASARRPQPQEAR